MPYHRGAELRRAYERATATGYGFVASNITTLDTAVGLLNGAERAGSDVVLQIKRDTAAYLGSGNPVAGLEIAGEAIRRLAADREVGVFLNVDHLQPGNEAFLEACLASGHPSSVMIDASDAAFEENVEITRGVVDAVAEDVLVEAELGTIAGTEGGVETAEALYTDPDDAVRFVERASPDLLAVSIGTQHGVAAGADLDLRIDLARDIDAALRAAGHDVPLVVHGSSGLSPSQVRELLTTGVCKLNVNTRYQYEYARTAFEFYRERADSILPPEGVPDDRATLFSGGDWEPVKADFTPHAVMAAVRERTADVMVELSERAGSAGESLFA